MSQPDTSPQLEAVQRKARQAWLDALPVAARRRQRLAALGTCLSGALMIVQAGCIAWLVQQVLFEKQPLASGVTALVILGSVLLLRAGLSSLVQAAAGDVADAAKLALRERVYRQLLGRGPLWLRQQRSGELGELMLSHADAIENYYSGFQPVRVEVVVVPLLMAIAVASVDWVVAVILVLTAPMVPFFMMLVGWGAEAAGRAQLGELARMSGHFADRIKGLGVLRLYGRGQAELEGVEQAAEGVRVRTMKVLRIAFLSSTVLEFFASVSVAMVALYLGLSYLGLMSLHAQVPTLGAGLFCLLLAPEFYAPLRRLAAHYHDRANALAAAAEVERLLGGLPGAADDSIVAPAAAEPLQRHAHPLQARQLTLRPLGAHHDVLHDISFQIEARQRVALVGPSGSGKSTLLEALAGWLQPQHGSVILQPGQEVGYAGQRPYLFHGSIADNLRVADPTASEATLRAAAETAQVMRFAAQLPKGLDTVIGERGFGLSGGEARRIGLARLLLRNPSILLLDEPTAFLDPQTEAALLRALAVHARGKTLLVATHSPVVMAWADRCLHLPEGRMHDVTPGELRMSTVPRPTDTHRDSLRAVFLRHRPRLLLAVLLLWTTMLAGTALLGLSGGFLTAAALAGAAGIGNGFNFFSPSAGIRGLTMARIVSRYFEKLVGHDVTLRIARDARVWFFRRALPLAPARLGTHRTGELLARLLGDIGELDGLWVRALAPLLSLLAMALVAIAVVAFILPPAALLLALMALLIGVGVPWIGVRGRQTEEADRAAYRANLRNLSFEGIEGAADLAALQATAHWQGGVEVAARQLRARDRRRRWRLVSATALHGLCTGAGVLGMLALALHAYEQGRVDAPMAAALVFLTVALVELWAGLGLAWQSLQSGRIAAGRLQAIVEQEPPTADPAQPQAVPAGVQELHFENIGFAWSERGRTLLQGLQLRVPVGQRIAISGDSGCGKTTLSSLALRLWDPQHGSVSWGGVDLRQFTLEQWHAHVAWLPQNAPVFAGSVADNLRLGDPLAGDEALWAMLERVRLGEWARAVGGLQGWVGENGATLSAGQARRLALARALLRGAPLLVLDEPTEGLDVDTAHALLTDLPGLLDGRSLLMITHDVMPPGVVDHVYRLEQGRLHTVRMAQG